MSSNSDCIMMEKRSQKFVSAIRKKLQGNKESKEILCLMSGILPVEQSIYIYVWLPL